MEQICKFCGAAFTTKRTTQKYCCHKCHNKSAWQVQKRRPKPQNICSVCGKVYESWSRTTAYCSRSCAGLDRVPKCARTETVDALMAYCCQKWNREGMTPTAIAAMTRHPLKLVQKALKIKLDKADYGLMTEYRR